MGNTKLLSQRDVFAAKHFTVFQTEVQVGEGIQSQHYVSANNAVCVIPLTEQNEIYLIKQYRYIFDNYYLEVISGFIDKGEEPEIAAKRELLEETGLVAKTFVSLGEVEMASSFLKFSQFYFIAKGLQEGQQQLEDTEDIEVVKIPLQEAVEKVLTGEINNQKTIVGILLANELLRTNKI